MRISHRMTVTFVGGPAMSLLVVALIPSRSPSLFSLPISVTPWQVPRPMPKPALMVDTKRSLSILVMVSLVNVRL